MRLDLDTYKEILDTITRNKSRSLLTGFGVFWGVFISETAVGVFTLWLFSRGRWKTVKV